METFETVNYCVNTTKTGLKMQQTFEFFPKRFRVNVAQVSIIECVRLVNEGWLLLVIDCDGCGY